MLTILWNGNNLFKRNMESDFLKKLGCPIGVSAEIPQNIRDEFAKIAPVELYDTCLMLDSASDKDFEEARLCAEKISARRVLVSVGALCDIGGEENDGAEKLCALKDFFLEKNISIMISNRREYKKGCCVSSARLLRMAEKADVQIAFDIGAAHAYLHALEDYYDLSDRVGAIMLNDNLGRLAELPVGHPLRDPYSRPDAMWQPGYGNAPFYKIYEDAKKNNPDILLFFNGYRYQNADLELVWDEINAVLENRVYLSPAGARFGKNESYRLLIKK